MSYGSQALKGLFLANGAAAIAMLAFLGNIMARAGTLGDETRLATVFARPLVLFAFGTIASIVAAFAAYIAQTFYTHGSGAQGVAPQFAKMNRLGNVARRTCVVVGIMAAALFIWGLASASVQFDGLPK